LTIYFGDTGRIELKRDAIAGASTTILDPADVNVDRRRFGLDDRDHSALVTGDQVDIRTADGSTLELVAGHVFPDWRGYVHVDPLGGIRLYSKFEDAVAGGYDTALALIAPTTAKEIVIDTRNAGFRCLAKVRDYQFTSQREQVQITTLGDEFIQQYEAGLISGQGQLQCLWEHRAALCDPTATNATEFPAYLAYLVTRVQQGAAFAARFVIYDGGEEEYTVWYEADCIATSCTVSVPAGGVVESGIQFVTTGAFRLRTGYLPSYLLQEDKSSYILQEDGSKIQLAVGD
jgi:hypothetical protein